MQIASYLLVLCCSLAFAELIYFDDISDDLWEESGSNHTDTVHFNITEDGVTCIMVELAGRFRIPYNTTKNNNTAHISIPKTATADTTGDKVCKNKTDQNIMIVWSAEEEEQNPESDRILTLTFTSDKTKFKVAEVEFDFYVDKGTFPDAVAKDKNIVVNVSDTDPVFAATMLPYSYQCEATQDLVFPASPNGYAADVTLQISHIKIQAFMNEKKDKFGTASICAADAKAVSDFVPIAVGCALAALVVVVIVAYLVGRHRAKKSEYEKM